MGAGRSVTFPRVVELLKKEVERTGQRATARATGVAQQAIHRYLKGNSEPTQASLQKLADYFGYTVAWLRGDESSATFETLSKFLKIEANQNIALNRIIEVLRIDGEWGKDGLFAAIAEKIGLSSGYVERALTGNQVLTEIFLEKIAGYLGVAVTYLLEGGKTHTRIVERLKDDISNTSLQQLSNITGISMAALSRYSQGIGVPSQVALEKLSDYFIAAVSYLRGEPMERVDVEVHASYLTKRGKAYLEIIEIVPDRLKGFIIQDMYEWQGCVASFKAGLMSSLTEEEEKALDEVYMKIDKIMNHPNDPSQWDR